MADHLSCALTVGHISKNNTHSGFRKVIWTHSFWGAICWRPGLSAVEVAERRQRRLPVGQRRRSFLSDLTFCLPYHVRDRQPGLQTRPSRCRGKVQPPCPKASDPQTVFSGFSDSVWKHWPLKLMDMRNISEEEVDHRDVAAGVSGTCLGGA